MAIIWFNPKILVAETGSEMFRDTQLPAHFFICRGKTSNASWWELSTFNHLRCRDVLPLFPYYWTNLPTTGPGSPTTLKGYHVGFEEKTLKSALACASGRPTVEPHAIQASSSRFWFGPNSPEQAPSDLFGGASDQKKLKQQQTSQIRFGCVLGGFSGGDLVVLHRETQELWTDAWRLNSGIARLREGDIGSQEITGMVYYRRIYTYIDKNNVLAVCKNLKGTAYSCSLQPIRPTNMCFSCSFFLRLKQICMSHLCHINFTQGHAHRQKLTLVVVLARKPSSGRKAYSFDRVGSIDHTPKMMVYNWKSHWKGYLGGTPISGNLHSVNMKT